MARDKIGIGIVTCGRPKFFKECATSILDTHRSSIDEFITINDDKTSIDMIEGIQYVMNRSNIGVGGCKNKILKHLMKTDCDHIFLVEDDVIFKSTEVLNKYITLSEVSGVKHLNFCLHGEDNKINGEPEPKLIVDYSNGVQMSLYHNVYGALSYYHRSVINEIGLIDKRYFNAMEHVDHTMEAINAGYHPPFRWFADVKDSDLLIGEQDHNHSDSKIRSRDDWTENFKRGVSLFYEKHHINVCDPNQVCDTKDDVMAYLKTHRKRDK